MSPTLSEPLGLVAIAEFVGLVLTYPHVSLQKPYNPGGIQTSGSSGGDNSTVQTGLGDEINLNGRVTARVVDRAGMDLGDRHFGWII